MDKKVIFVTGAGSGIGKAIAEKFAQENYDVVAIDVSNSLPDLAKEWEKKYKIKVMPLIFDIRDKKKVFSAIDNLPEEWKKVDVLVNCAGLALGRDKIQDGNIDDWDTMIDVNVKGMLYIFKAIVPFMLKNKRGHIINIGSVTGKEIYPAGGIYAATKHMVLALNGFMRVDLVECGIKVSVVNPGRTHTKLALVRYKGDKSKAVKDYEGFTPLEPQDVANAVYYVAAQPEHVNIQELTITPAMHVGANYICKNKI